jgi:hypothetical protein
MLHCALAIGLSVGSQAMAAGSSRIALPSGHFSFTAQGTEATCAAGPCITLNIIETGNMIRDSAGNACGSHSAVVTTIPATAGAPIVVPSVITVLSLLNYDAATGTGDASLSEFSGGACNGSTFDAAGATQIGSGALHFTVSSGDNANGGDRIDSIITALNVQGSAVPNFSIVFTERQQKSTGN